MPKMVEEISKKSTKRKTKLLSLAEAAEITGYTPEYLNLRCRQGKLRAEKKGRNWFTTLRWVEEFSKENISNGKGGGARFFSYGEQEEAEAVSRKEETEKEIAEETKKEKSQQDIASTVLAALNSAEESRRQEERRREENQRKREILDQERREKENALMREALEKNVLLIDQIKNKWEKKEDQPKKSILNFASPFLMIAFAFMVWFLSKENSVVNLYNNVGKNIASHKEDSSSGSQVAGTESEGDEKNKQDFWISDESMTELEKKEVASTVLSAFGVTLDGNGDLAGDIRIKRNEKIRVEANAIDSEKIRDHTILARDIDDDIKLKVKELISKGNITAGGNLIVSGSLVNSGSVSFQNGLVVSNGNVVFSTSGTITQTGLGQVAFAGNVDAQNGMDVTGGNLTVGGNNFSVNSLNGNIITSGDLDASTATIGIIDGTSLLFNTANITSANVTNLDLGTNTITDGNFSGNWNFHSGNLTNVGNILPAADMTYSLGSPSLRFLDVYAGTLHLGGSTNDGQAIYTYEPLTTSVSQSSLYINPAAAIPNAPLLGIAINGDQRFLVDEDGDVTIDGVINSNGTGDNYFLGNVGVGTTSPDYALDIQNGYVNASSGLCINGSCQTTWNNIILPSGINGQTLYNNSSTWTATSNLFNNGTNVGIGTTNPDYKLV
ncbi:MAG TPA: hypothetical protein PLK35_02880, partial [Candidatus Moranbacteria bacterium]|nr:hypothetical protein [Candidatus Moranbacteria bacterium]